MPLGSLKGLGSTAAGVAYTVFCTPTESITDNLPPGSHTSSQVTANVTGGQEPYTFTWTKLSGGPIGISDSSAQVVTFNASSGGGDLQATYEVEVEDNLAATVTTTINVEFLFLE